MPIYEYRCNQCGTVLELFTKVGTHSDPLACKSCGSTQLEKMLSAASVGSTDTSQSSCSPKESCYTPTCGTAPGGG
ncbi:MAG: zinc ribbon domain-containing protein [Proteobacteria bacterium]|nr:zinc ribbon domain-containing protein [Pseudomonadota bacterium]